MSYILTIPLIYGVQKVQFKELCLDIQATLGQFLRSIKIFSRKRMKGEKRQTGLGNMKIEIDKDIKSYSSLVHSCVLILHFRVKNVTCEYR